jgi:5-(carboxyamino)imidazole ribonucleotide synthase
MHNPRVGAIGGGQLARMMGDAAAAAKVEFSVLAEVAGSSAQAFASTVGDYNQLSVVERFAETVDVITFDHEHVPLEVLRSLEADSVSVQPPSKALAFAQNKLKMRQRLSVLNLPMPVWREIKTADDLTEFIGSVGGVAILKTPIGGYDGKGVRVVRSVADAKDWLDNIDDFGGSLLAEEKVDFVRELAQLSARNTNAEFAAWPLVETRQVDGVCAVVIAPAPNSSSEMLERCEQIARAIAEDLGVTGVLAVEMFEARDGRILINELAMRPHNSGHFSIEGSATSQFEQHLRAVAGLPLGPTNLLAGHAVMVNLLGTGETNTFVEHFALAAERHPAAHLHAYGKAARKGRKMGHVTVVDDDLDFALAEANAAAAVLLQGN